MKFCSEGVTAQWICDCKTCTEAWLDTRHCRKCAFTNVAYVDPNMESIFEFNNLRFSPDMFCHISVIKDDCCIVVYACSFLPEHLQCEWLGKPKIGAGSPLHCWCCDYSCLNEFLRWHFPHFVFSLNKCVHSDAQFYRTNGCWWLFELNSAKVRACKCSIMHTIYYVSTYVCSCLKIIYEKQNDLKTL